MKKLTIYSISCLITSILFSSCSSHFAITKRHYSRGYYIDYSTHKQLALNAREKAQTRITNSDYPMQAPLDNIAKVISVSRTQKIAASPTDSKNEKKQNKAIFQRSGKEAQVQKNPTEINEFPVAQIKQTSTVLSSITDEDHPSRRDVLSLFWIVILVVLILWLIGILTGSFGIGGFINLLLLVALVLLILWLLRII